MERRSLSHMVIDLKWEQIFREKATELSQADAHVFDPAHDVLHFERVAKTAKALCAIEQANEWVVTPAAWLHDFIVVPKSDPRRSQASKLSAAAAIEFLESVDYPAEFYDRIAHAIEAHSFSAGIEPRTIEACIVQDADRLDALGAIGLARLFITAGLMRRPICSLLDPFCESRPADDSRFTIDHIYKKLFVVADSLKTEGGRDEGRRRRAVLQTYLDELAREI